MAEMKAKLASSDKDMHIHTVQDTYAWLLVV